MVCNREPYTHAHQYLHIRSSSFLEEGETWPFFWGYKMPYTFVCVLSACLKLNFIWGLKKTQENEENTKTITHYLRCNNLPLEK